MKQYLKRLAALLMLAGVSVTPAMADVVIKGKTNEKITFYSGSMKTAEISATGQFSPTAGVVNPSSMMFRNRLINGNFDIWQRGAGPFTLNDVYTADRWVMGGVPGSSSATLQAFTVGQTEVPGEPTNFIRVAHNVNSQNYPWLTQRIEGVRTCANRTCTLSFWARSSAGSPSLTIRPEQNFGSGGSAISYLSEPTISITNTWAKYTYSWSVPSISGKTVGANNHLGIVFLNRGASTGTIDFAQAQFEEGPIATPFEFRPYGVELQLAQRYYEKQSADGVGYVNFGSGWFVTGGGVFEFYIKYSVPKRAIPVTLSWANVMANDGLANHGLSDGSHYLGTTSANLRFVSISGGTPVNNRPYNLTGFGAGTGWVAFSSEL
jgi:hypothetical protein